MKARYLFMSLIQLKFLGNEQKLASLSHTFVRRKRNYFLKIVPVCCVMGTANFIMETKFFRIEFKITS